jgi:hypothetical protein
MNPKILTNEELTKLLNPCIKQQPSKEKKSMSDVMEQNKKQEK